MPDLGPPAALPPLWPDGDVPAWYHEDNLFPSRERLDEVHAPIVDLAVRTLAAAPGPVLDLGCGNGALLRKIHEQQPRAIPHGVELHADRVAHARLLLPAFARNFVSGDMFSEQVLSSLPGSFALALLSPRRLEEAGMSRSAQLLSWIQQRASRLLVYGYGTSLQEPGGLAGFARRFGLLLEQGGPDVRASLAHQILA